MCVASVMTCVMLQKLCLLIGFNFSTCEIRDLIAKLIDKSFFKLLLNLSYNKKFPQSSSKFSNIRDGARLWGGRSECAFVDIH